MGDVGEDEYRTIMRAMRLWGIISTPDYANGDDGLGDLVTKEVLIYAAQGVVFVDDSYLARNFRSAKIKSRDTRRLRIPHGEVPGNHTSLEEYHQDFRAYMNA